MLITDFDFDLPDALIAQRPAEPRDRSRLMILDRQSGRIGISRFAALPEHLRSGDLLVVNDSRVFAARLYGQRVPTGGAVECLLLERLDAERWDALVHPGQKLGPGQRFVCTGPGGSLVGEILDRRTFGRRTIRLEAAGGADVARCIDAIGHVPLPPYIKRPDEPADRERYQTIFAKRTGSVAAPTAALHFSPDLVAALGAAGVGIATLTLHVGYGTFKPVRGESIDDHRVDAEPYDVPADTAARICETKARGGRIIAVGTTSTRALESAAIPEGGVLAGAGRTELFIRPGHVFRVVDGLVTNFHLPRSSLLVLVGAFGGRERVLAAYHRAVSEGFRFYSYGDAMLIA